MDPSVTQDPSRPAARDRAPGAIGRLGSFPAPAVTAALTIFYLVACHLGLRLASINQSATPVWPGTGIAFAAFLIIGPGAWPAILLGAFLVNLATAGTAATSIGIAVGNTLEGFVGAWLVERWAGGRRLFERPQHVFKFVGLAGVISTALSATIGVTSLALGGFAPWGRFGSVWFTWWLGNMSGDLMVAPFLILWFLEPRIRFSQAQAFEALTLLTSLILVGLLVFGGFLPADGGAYPLEFLCIPFLVWVAFRFGPRETVTATLTLAAIAVFGTMRGQGPFHRPDRNESLLLLQAFLGTSSVMALALAAVVRERGRGRQELERQAAELERSNADLQHFAAIASHDLREPLRVVTSFVELLARRYRGRLDADADEYIRYAVEGASRMRDMIDGVLAVSKAGRQSPAMALIDCGGPLETAIANLRHPIDESRAIITRGEMPRLVADPIQLAQVFQNLIDNALKFRGPGAPEVRIGARKDGQVWIFSVGDNGIGIPPEWTGRLFGLFRRLHTKEEYPGIGAGLAICRNVVERHGGRIWVTSQPGVGSTFFFTLPAAPSEDAGRTVR